MTTSIRPLRICLLGQPFWAGRLQTTIHRYFPGQVTVSTLFPQRHFSRECWGQAKQADVLVRVGYRPAASTPMGRIYEVFWRYLRRANPTARVAYYWIGTDVWNAVREVHQNPARRHLLAATSSDLHITDAPWLQDELRSIGIEAEQVHFPAPILKAATLPPLPQEFSVLTYIPDRRSNFYGGPAVAEAARRFPKVPFHVVGGKGSWQKKSLPNLYFHGWQKDLDSFYRSATVLLRLIEHDALGATVQEALCYGRHVIYSYRLPHCLQAGVRDIQLLIGRLEGLLEQHEAGLLDPNRAGWNYGTSEFDEGRFCGQFLKLLSQTRHSIHQARATEASA